MAELKVFRNITFLGEMSNNWPNMSNNWPNNLLGTNIYKTPESCR